MFINITDRVKKYYFIAIVILLLIIFSVFIFTPSTNFKSVVNSEINAIKKDWKKWDKINKKALELKDEASKRKNKLYARGNALSDFVEEKNNKLKCEFIIEEELAKDLLTLPPLLKCKFISKL